MGGDVHEAYGGDVAAGGRRRGDRLLESDGDDSPCPPYIAYGLGVKVANEETGAPICDAS